MMFQGLNNVWGPLDKKVQKRLRAVLDNPTPKTWDDAHCLIIRGDRFLTLWQAVIAVDPSFPHSARMDPKHKHKTLWDRIPDQMLIARAIRYARQMEVKGEIKSTKEDA